MRNKYAYVFAYGLHIESGFKILCHASYSVLLHTVRALIDIHSRNYTMVESLFIYKIDNFARSNVVMNIRDLNSLVMRVKVSIEHHEQNICNTVR